MFICFSYQIRRSLLMRNKRIKPVLFASNRRSFRFKANKYALHIHLNSLRTEYHGAPYVWQAVRGVGSLLGEAVILLLGFLLHTLTNLLIEERACMHALHQKPWSFSSQLYSPATVPLSFMCSRC